MLELYAPVICEPVTLAAKFEMLVHALPITYMFPLKEEVLFTMAFVTPTELQLVVPHTEPLPSTTAPFWQNVIAMFPFSPVP